MKLVLYFSWYSVDLRNLSLALFLCAYEETYTIVGKQTARVGKREGGWWGKKLGKGRGKKMH